MLLILIVSRIIHICVVATSRPCGRRSSGQSRRASAAWPPPCSPGTKCTTSSPVTPPASFSGQNRRRILLGRIPRRVSQHGLTEGSRRPGPPQTRRLLPLPVLETVSLCGQQCSLPHRHLKGALPAQTGLLSTHWHCHGSLSHLPCVVQT